MEKMKEILSTAKEKKRDFSRRCIVCNKFLENGMICNECFHKLGDFICDKNKFEMVEIYEIKKRKYGYVKYKVKRIMTGDKNDEYTKYKMQMPQLYTSMDVQRPQAGC